jgi:hypothetical protein
VRTSDGSKKTPGGFGFECEPSITVRKCWIKRVKDWPFFLTPAQGLRGYSPGKLETERRPMTMRTNKKNQRRVEFDRPLEVRVRSIDGTWCGDGFLIDISDTEAQIEATGQAAELAEFFLVLTSFGSPVFRRCKRRWVRGARIFEGTEERLP